MRKWLARLLYPQAFVEAERYHWLRGQIDLAHRWMGEFAEIDAFTNWLRYGDANRNRQLDEMPKYCRWNGDISGFREQLRRKEHLTAPAE